MDASADMVRGYLAGYRSGAPDLPDCHCAKSAAFRHGWLNGRDDRLGRPREVASVLLARADLILANTNASCGNGAY